MQLLRWACPADEGAMERFAPDERERNQLVAWVAEECSSQAQSEWAIELFRYANQPARALRIISHLFSDRLEPALSEPASGESGIWLCLLTALSLPSTSLPQVRFEPHSCACLLSDCVAPALAAPASDDFGSAFHIFSDCLACALNGSASGARWSNIATWH